MDGARNEEGLMQQQEEDLQRRARPPEDQQQPSPSLPPQRCPRCDSSNTKFCYYNNYSLSQPRYFCKACRRYWTHGGTLRNVPIGGGCRKTKRPRISPPSSSLSSNGMISRPQGLPTTAARSQNPALLMSGPPSRPVAPPLAGGAFYAGGSFLSSLAAMQSNQGVAAMGGGGRFGPNMALLQGMSFQSFKSPVAAAPLHNSTPPPHFLPPQQNLIPPGTFSSWTQSVINAGATSSSAASMWSSSSGGGGGGRAGSSSAANQWSDCNPGFNPSE